MPRYRWIKQFVAEARSPVLAEIFMIASKIKVDDVKTGQKLGPGRCAARGITFVANNTSLGQDGLQAFIEIAKRGRQTKWRCR